MEIFYTLLLAAGAFWLGACPFSVWTGRLILGRDVRNYGDHNPGAANAFRAGGLKAGCLALALDVAKGIPFVLLARSFSGLSEIATAGVALAAILGHAFSPLLAFRGGKAIAVTYGVLLALAEPEILVLFAGFMFAAFLCIDNDAWVVMPGPAGSLAYLLVTRGTSWEPLFVLCVLIVFLIKQFPELKTMPRLKFKPARWLFSRKRVV
jgi:glycerol-3-phosphate acyltransferase PlsY